MINQNALYIVKIPLGKDLEGLAIQMQRWPINPEPGEKTGIAFHSTTRGHLIRGTITEKADGTIIVQRNKKHEDPFIFRPCTLEMYRQKYYKMCENGQEIADMCTSTDDLWEYYCRLYQRGEFDTY